MELQVFPPGAPANEQVILHFGIILTLIVSITAIYIAIRAYHNTSKLYSIHIKPLLSITYAYPKYQRRISMSNYGMGTAVIRKIRFIKDDRVYDELWQAFSDIEGKFWTRDQVFAQDVFLLKPTEEVILGELKAQNIVSSGRAVGPVFENFKKNLDGLEVRIYYSNIAGEVQEPFRRVISVGGRSEKG